MPAGYQDQFLEQGTTFKVELTLDDVYGSPINLTGYTIRSQARRSYYSANATINFVASITNANNGLVTLSANSAVTANVPAGKLVYDVIATDTGTGTITRILEGQIFVSPAATKSGS
jgi:hypothetical protein